MQRENKINEISKSLLEYINLAKQVTRKAHKMEKDKNKIKILK